MNSHESGQADNDHQEAYDTFFVIKKTPKRGLKISYNNQAVNQYINRYSGFQALLTNSIKDPIEALQKIPPENTAKVYMNIDFGLSVTKKAGKDNQSFSAWCYGLDY